MAHIGPRSLDSHYPPEGGLVYITIDQIGAFMPNFDTFFLKKTQFFLNNIKK